jgi:nicotinamide mononucleotide transporter
MQDVIQHFFENIKQTSPLEYIAVVAGILSVWFSKKENILVYPIGLINTIAYVYLSINQSLFGEAAVNFYYTVMSLMGWWAWSKKDMSQRHVLHISYSTAKEWMNHVLFFLFFYVSIFLALTWAKEAFYANTVPALDAFASASAFTGMWLMTRKKVESWYWWIITNITSIPLYFYKGLVLTSVYYFILLILAVFGLMEWRKKVKQHGGH